MSGRSAEFQELLRKFGSRERCLALQSKSVVVREELPQSSATSSSSADVAVAATGNQSARRAPARGINAIIEKLEKKAQQNGVPRASLSSLSTGGGTSGVLFPRSNTLPVVSERSEALRQRQQQRVGGAEEEEEEDGEEEGKLRAATTRRAVAPAADKVHRYEGEGKLPAEGDEEKKEDDGEEEEEKKEEREGVGRLAKAHATNDDPPPTAPSLRRASPRVRRSTYGRATPTVTTALKSASKHTSGSTKAACMAAATAAAGIATRRKKGSVTEQDNNDNSDDTHHHHGVSLEPEHQVKRSQQQQQKRRSSAAVTAKEEGGESSCVTASVASDSAAEVVETSPYCEPARAVGGARVSSEQSNQKVVGEQKTKSLRSLVGEEAAGVAPPLSSSNRRHHQQPSRRHRADAPHSEATPHTSSSSRLTSSASSATFTSISSGPDAPPCNNALRPESPSLPPASQRQISQPPPVVPPLWNLQPAGRGEGSPFSSSAVAAAAGNSFMARHHQQQPPPPQAPFPSPIPPLDLFGSPLPSYPLTDRPISAFQRDLDSHTIELKHCLLDLVQRHGLIQPPPIYPPPPLSLTPRLPLRVDRGSYAPHLSLDRRLTHMQQRSEYLWATRPTVASGGDLKPVDDGTAKPTHFIAIRVDTEELVHNVYEFQKSIVRKVPNLKPCAINPAKLHISVLMLCLASATVQTAIEAVQKGVEDFARHITANKLQLDFNVVGTFGQRVLFATVPREQQQLLQRLHSCLVQRCDAVGLSAVGIDKEAPGTARAAATYVPEAVHGSAPPEMMMLPTPMPMMPYSSWQQHQSTPQPQVRVPPPPPTPPPTLYPPQQYIGPGKWQQQQQAAANFGLYPLRHEQPSPATSDSDEVLAGDPELAKKYDMSEEAAREVEIKGSFFPHMALFKTSQGLRRIKNRKKRKMFRVLPEYFVEQIETAGPAFSFGTHNCCAIDLLEMSYPGRDGYYNIVRTFPLVFEEGEEGEIRE